MFGSTTTSSEHSICNPFATKPLTATLGPPIGMSSGATAGLFGETLSPFQSTTAFSVPSSPAFGGSKTAFGSFSSAPAPGFSSAPAFGFNSTGFGGSSVFGQKPAFGATTTSTTEVGFNSAPTFGNSTIVVGSRKDLNGTTNSSFKTQSSFLGSQMTTEPFGRKTIFASPIGMSNSNGTTTSLFGTTPSPLQSTTTFSIPSSPAFGSFSSAPALGFSSAPALGFSSSGFGGSSVLGQKSAFGASSTTEIGFSSTPTFGNSTKVVSSRKDMNGTTNSSFGTQSSFSGSHVTNNGQSVFGSQMRGSRIATYKRTIEIDTNAKQKETLESISAMPVYKDKSHEELRCEDYKFGDKGGIASHNLNPFSATTPFTSQAFPSFNAFFSSTTAPSTVSTKSLTTSSHNLNPFSATPSTSQAFPSLNPFSATTPFTSQAFPSFNAFFSSTTAPSTVSTKSLTTSSHNLNPFSATTPSTSQAFPSLNPFFSSPAAPSTVSSKSLTISTHSLNPFSATAPYTSQAFPSLNPFFSSTAPTTASTKSITTSSCMPFTSVTPPDFSFSPVHPPTSIPPANPAVHFPLQAPSAAGFSTFLNSPATSGSFFVNSTSTTSVPIPSTTFIGEASGRNLIAQGSGSQATAAGHWSSGVNPFGSLPPILKMSIDGPGSSPTVQYGISNLPVQNKPAPVRVSSLLTVRHLYQRKKLTIRKYDPKDNGHKVSFFSDNNEMPNSLFVPRENPRALVIQPSEHWPLTADSEKLPGLGEELSTIHLNENGENSIGDDVSNRSDTPKLELADDLTKMKHLPLNVLEVEALLPKLQLSGYYTEPQIQELAAKEREDPGFCGRVKNFVVGRHGYGSIMFMGEIDVRKLDVESCVQFNYREVIVYEDESKKPPVGQGLNNPAEVTLLNIKCTDKKTGNQIMDGPKVDKYREMLMKKAAAQGAEFVSYDPVGGEWKFRVQHF